MSAHLLESLAPLLEATRHDGYTFVEAPRMRTLMAPYGSFDDWATFAASWDALGPDPYLQAHGRQRRRRYAVFAAKADGAIVREPHQPHYQSPAYNPLQGGIERWFDPVLPEVAGSRSLRSILAFACDVFGRLAPTVPAWHIELHQFRIEACPGQPGEPTPEGVHRDGVDYVLVLMIQRRNIERGTTTIHAPDGRPLGSFTLAQPFDAALVDDRRVFHGVTPVVPLDPTRPAHRDVLVVTLRALGAVPPTS